MSTAQQATVDAILRQSALPVGSDVSEQRRRFREAVSAREIRLEITPRVAHVFQAYAPILDEAAAALDRAGALLSTHLAGGERRTA